MNKPNNPPAFPQLPSQVYSHISHKRLPDVPGNPGMTLRDYFAACALQGLLSDRGSALTAQEAAQEAFLTAQAMLEERAKQ